MTITITSHSLLSMKDTTLGEAGTVPLGSVRIRARETYVHCDLIVLSEEQFEAREQLKEKANSCRVSNSF
jgi:CRISPR/Cas system CSM-associated protein Csm3 (group 7 of RAMP superfamily)